MSNGRDTHGWIVLSLTVTLTSALAVLLSKHLHTRGGENANALLMATLSVVGVIALVILFCSDHVSSLRTMRFDASLGVLVVGLAALIVLDWFVFAAAISRAPHPGLAHCIVNMNVVAVLILSAVFFGNHIGRASALGVFLSIAGAAIIVLSEANSA